MTVLREVQPRIFALTGGLFANWLPDGKIEVGDYGIVERERFVRDGSLRDYGIAIEIEQTKKAKAKLEYSDRAQIQVSASVSGKVGASDSATSARAAIHFSGRGAFLYHLSGLTEQRLSNSRIFFEELARKCILGEFPLNENTVIVSELRLADKASIIVSDANNGSIELQGNFPASGNAIFADVKGGLSVSNSSGSMFKWLATDGTIPILGLVRPVIGSPSGGPNALVGLLTRLRQLFRERRWDIREIILHSVTSENGQERTSASIPIPDGGALSFQLAAVDIGDFLRPRAPEAVQTGFVEESVPTHQVRTYLER